MKLNRQWKGAAIGASIAVSVLVLTPIVGAADGQNPDRLCIDNGSARHCDVLIVPDEAGGSGRAVAVATPPTGRLDAKDHPNYGSVTSRPAGRLDAKDHPNYGPVTVDRASVVAAPLGR